jgi:hypothetical protein
MRYDEEGRVRYLSESGSRRGQVRRGQPEGLERGYKCFAGALDVHICIQGETSY